MIASGHDLSIDACPGYVRSAGYSHRKSPKCPRAENNTEIGDAENISKSYVSRFLRLALLAPDIVEPILEVRANQSPVLERLEGPPPASWVE
jgi:hypothetical protein